MDEKTAQAASDAANKGQDPEPPTGKDENAQKADSQTVEDEKLPFDQHPKWKSARLAEKKVQEILKANDLTDIDDLVDLVESGKKVKGKISDVDQIDSLMKKAETLDRYEQYWREQDEKQKRSGEQPDETIARLEKQLKEKEAKEREIQTAEQTKTAITNYYREVKDQIREIEGHSKAEREFLAEFCGVDNLSMEIDITDRKAVKRMVADGARKMKALQQAIIKDYLDGKTSIPKVSPTDTSIADKPNTIRTLKEARRVATETWTSRGA